jgi:hypothetical protein
MRDVTTPLKVAPTALVDAIASSSQTGRDSLSSIENVIGGSGGDLITGNDIARGTRALHARLCRKSTTRPALLDYRPELVG